MPLYSPSDKTTSLLRAHSYPMIHMRISKLYPTGLGQGNLCSQLIGKAAGSPDRHSCIHATKRVTDKRV
jgi:hypothetical protein